MTDNLTSTQADLPRSSRKQALETLVRLALPAIVQQMLSSILQYVDTAMVGRLGDIALSSVNISGQFPYLYMTVAMGLSNAGLIIAAQAYPGRVLGMCPAPGYERVAPAEKRMTAQKFTVYVK